MTFAIERRGQRARPGRIHFPLAPVGRDRFEVPELRENRGGGFRAPARQPRISVGRVANQCEVVRIEAGGTPNFAITPASSRIVLRPAIQLDDARSAH